MQKEIIKTYLEEGGFILAEACCGDKEFATSFKLLMKELFPDNTFRKIAPEHAILSMFPGITPKDFPEIEVMERGCRTVCVFSPIPLAGYWEEDKYMPKDGRNPGIAARRRSAWSATSSPTRPGWNCPNPNSVGSILSRKGPKLA